MSLPCLLVFGTLIVLASIAGGVIPLVVRLTHKRLELAVSFIAGVMLGVGVLHLIPHAVTARLDAIEHATEPHRLDHAASHQLMDPIAVALLAGFLTMFLLERYFRFHHHEAPPPAPGRCDQPVPSTGSETVGDPAGGDGGLDCGPACAHRQDPDDARPHEHGAAESSDRPRSRLGWIGAAAGLSIHSLIEGVALAASIEAGVRHGETGWLAGLATFLVIFLHKPLDSLTLGTLMAMGHRSVAARHTVNILFALLIPAGAGLFYLGLRGAGGDGAALSLALAFTAGTFLCIAMSDLLPELQFHQHDRAKLSTALVLGLLVAWGTGLLEQRAAMTAHEEGHRHLEGSDHADHHDHDGDGVPDH